MVMINDDGNEFREGLMVKGERIIQNYPNDYRARLHAEKYSEVILTLEKQHAVSNWMTRNQVCWAWIEPEAYPETGNPLQSRSDHPDRRGGRHKNTPVHHQHHDPNTAEDSGIDDDSRSDEDDDLVPEIIVDGCGVSEINGIFKHSGSYDGVPKYSMHSRYLGKDVEFSLFRCKLTDNTR